MRQKVVGKRRRSLITFCLLLWAGLISAPASFAQQSEKPRPATTIQTTEPQLVRVASRHEVRRFGYGGTITLVGAPRGAITIEGWNKSEVELFAEIEVRAYNEADLARLAAVNTFVFDEDVNHLRILTTGMHDRKYLRRVAKDFPKSLLSLPWKIEYRLRVPAATDLRISAGDGPLNISGVEGAIQLEGGETKTRLELTGGTVRAILGRGSFNLRAGARSWRGSGIVVQLGTGDLTVELPPGFNGDVDATVLRTGRVENSYSEITPAERTTQTERFVKGRSGQGGATLSFTVGDGTLRIKPASAETP